jgi:predicted small lipoprotein YifL
VIQSSSRALARAAVFGAMAAALALTGCGRKGPLDLPPSAAISEPGPADPRQGSTVGPDGKPVAPRTGPNRPTILDWLVE